MNNVTSLMSDVYSMNSVRASQATKQIVQKTHNISGTTLHEINQQNSLPNFISAKAYSVNISTAALQKSNMQPA
ncbi:MAG: hypothetical protein HQL96_00490 [Magnetococcales bacterium]|nr:hypothetical protein [Magnetococcales bacterium]